MDALRRRTLWIFSNVVVRHQERVVVAFYEGSYKQVAEIFGGMLVFDTLIFGLSIMICRSSAAVCTGVWSCSAAVVAVVRICSTSVMVYDEGCTLSKSIALREQGLCLQLYHHSELGKVQVQQCMSVQVRAVQACCKGVSQSLR